MGETLLDLAKRKLRITYEDDATDKRLEEIIADAEAELSDSLGICDAGFDFSEAGSERSLLINLVFYEFNQAADEFWLNYAGKIAQCREKWMVRQYAQESQASTDVQ
jgi:hypothetical protein